MTASIPLERQAPPAEGGLRHDLVADLPVTDRRLDIEGIRTAMLDGGDGPPLLLLHGAGEFGATWLRVIPDLVADHTVIVPDLPGHGGSALGTRELDADLVLGWLEGVIRRTCSSPPVFVGHGMGGAIGARLAVRRPDVFRGLVLVDAYGLAPLRPSPAFALALIPFIVRPTRRTQRRLMNQCMADLDALRDTMGDRLDMLEAYALDRARHGEMTPAIRRLMPDLGRPAIPAADLARMTVPTTLIWGRQDLQVRLSVAEAAAARHGWPMHVIDGAADDPAVERPAEFLDALRAALADIKETT